MENQNEMLGADPAIPFLNAVEAWGIYDTIQIRSDAKEKEGYASYAALGAVPLWPFFDQRKSDVGIAYTNRDSNETTEFAYEIYSLGVRFVAPEGIVEALGTAGVGPDNKVIHTIFSRMIMEHVGLRLKVSQDDKLIHTCYMAPDGMGPNSPSMLVGPVLAVAGDQTGYGSYSNTNGEPHISGRWKFPIPIEVPRGSVFSVKLEPSAYCRDLISAMPGPGNYTFCAADDAETSKPASALIRVDMIGKRGVQQRNALHK